MKQKPIHGGARQGAGRPASDNPKVIISFRVPEDKAELLKEKIGRLIKKYSKPSIR